MSLESNTNMCRICLRNANKLNKIQEIDEEKRVSYIDMITSFTHLKIIGIHGYNKICAPCQHRLKETYDFKILIERSDMILNDIDPTKIKRFSNINEIKSEIACEDEKYFKHSIPTQLIKEIENGKISISYNDTVIRKIEIRNRKSKIEIPVIDYLQSIKKEVKCENIGLNDTSDCYSPRSDRDGDCLSWKPIKKKYRKKRKKGRSKEITHGTVCPAPIKPVFLEDVGVLYYDPQEKNNRKKLYKPKYASRNRKDICCYCGKLTRSLKTHQIVHTGERKFKCDICSKSYFLESQLKYHKKSHSNIRNFKCDLCIATFFTTHALERHMNRHSEVKNYFCNICSKGYKTKSSLTRHIRLHNLENKNVSCELCKMMFHTNYALRHHMRVHTGERPYKCEICSQPYSYKRDFNRHCLKKHGVFLKRRSVNVMNDEVLKRERTLMRELLLRKQGVIKDVQPFNPFEGPQAAIALEQVMEVLDTRPIYEDFT